MDADVRQRARVPQAKTLEHMITDAWRWHQSGGYEK